ncbi:FAD-dependent oxidoreductase [Gluconobacter sp.]|uniref:FAD-dependent oxidoreductase n=1 Tax=Gluconobacter sp. TaxID=1876758 RepID=UPI0039E7BF53
MSDWLSFTFNDSPVSAKPGQTLTAALMAAGRLVHRTAPDGSGRGPFCGIGACQDCLLEVDGQMSRRGCMTPVQAGMRVRSNGRLPDAAVSAPLARGEERLAEHVCEVLVVGAGPAGLVAATELARGGVDVLVVDERHIPGGQYFKQNAVHPERQDDQARKGRHLIEAMRASGARLWHDTLVWCAYREDGALVIGGLRDGEAFYIRAQHVIVATGAQETPAARPGWTLPGVITTGAGQTLLRAYEAVSPGRVVIAGNGPLNLQLAAELVGRGADVVAVVESAPAPVKRPVLAGQLSAAAPRLALAGMQHLWTLRRAGVPVLWESIVTRIEGTDRAERVIVAQAGAEDRSIEAETVCLGDGFVPASELPRLLGCRQEIRDWPVTHPETGRQPDGRTDQADVSVIGEAGRFGGAFLAQAQGALCAARLLEQAGKPVPPALERSRRMYRDNARFQTLLWKLYHPAVAFPPPEDTTILCRCECVTAGTVRARVSEDGIRDLATLKRATRAGMGRCQGRFCQASLMKVLPEPKSERDFTAPQIPLRPVPVAALARQKPEWRGHVRVPIPSGLGAVVQSSSAATETVDVVVVGGGIVGLFAALFLAEAGKSVVVLERGRAGALASGGNAGSLHAQLMAFDASADTEGPSMPARTLALQRESIRMWEGLRGTFDRDLEIKVSGGLVVAETEADMDRLRSKVAVEQSLDVDARILEPDELRRIEPNLRDGFLGGAYCSEEGKINPMAATLAVLARARRAGVQVEELTALSAIQREGSRFRISAGERNWSAGAVVNAAGAYAGEVAELVGRRLPVFGAPLQMIVTEPVAPLVFSLLAHASRHLTLKQAANGSLLIGGGWSAGLDPVHGHPRPLRENLEGNLWVAQRLVPALGAVNVVRSWAAMNIDIDGAPILGESPDVPGFFTAVTANGVTLAPAMGRHVADMVLHRSERSDLEIFSPARFYGDPS